MTYSICAVDGSQHGIAIATKAIGVGSLAPFLSRNGAVSTQSMVSIPIGVKAARLLDQECGIDAAVETLIDKDNNSTYRQVHGIDCWGNTAVFSGDDCVDWYGHIEEDTYTVAGNMLAGEKVINSIAEAFESHADLPLDEQLLLALQAGEDAGGDKRRETAQSAALKIYHPTQPGLHHDLRIDEHDDPINELQRIHDLAKAESSEWIEEYSEVDLQRWP